MDRQAPQSPTRRDVVFCHECEQEWYRDEHGLTCPDCQSDFTEIIEPDNDPRSDFAPDELLSPSSFPNGNPFDPGNAPDPDIDDINRVDWMDLPPRESAGLQRSDPNRAEVHRNFQNTFSGLLGANAPRTRVQGQWTMRTVNLGNGGSVTFSSSTLFPRDANGPQPSMMPVENLHNVLSSLLMGLDGPGGSRGPFTDPMGMPRGGVANPLGAFFNAMFNPAGAQHGDWVYSQEALDRVISQLMEQNATGNAPGPANAEAMANLPKVTVTKEMMGDNGKAECSICMDDVALNEEVSQLPCKHWFHEQCVKAWLAEHDTCPHCRKGIGELAQQQGNGRPSASRNTSGSPYPFPSSFPTTRRRSSGQARTSRRPSEMSSRRASESGHSGGGGSSSGGGLIDRARNLFGGRRDG